MILRKYEITYCRSLFRPSSLVSDYSLRTVSKFIEDTVTYRLILAREMIL